MENAHDGRTDSRSHLIRSPYDVCVFCGAATLDDGSPNQVGAGRVRGPGQIGMLVSICRGKGLLGIGGQEVEDKGETV